MLNFKEFILKESNNISTVKDLNTANTNFNVAKQRAKYLNKLGVNSVLELCVGPSLRILEKYYNQYGIDVTGNDIDSRWESFYPNGNWVIGDALSIDCTIYDAAVFAPPLSKGCTGNRCDYLSIDEVIPSYYDFLKENNCENIIVLVLPGKTFSLKEDTNQFYKLLDYIYSLGYSVINIKKMKGHKNKITKYIDVYLKK